MTPLKLTVREIAHRKLTFILGLLSVMIAVGVLVGAVALLRGHDLRTEAVIAVKEAQTREEMARMEDDYRRIMKDMGYNVLVLHEDQSFDEMQRVGYPTHYMPEDYAQRLADEKIESLNHLLPILQERAEWPEQGREVTLAGVRGQVPIFYMGREKMKPIMEPVEPDEIKLGYDIARDLGLSEGDTVTFRGLALKVAQVYDRRGTQDDQTVWVNLSRAQEWLGRPGQVNGILALECICSPDEVGLIERQVREILPDTRVYEFTSLIVARALARQRAEETRKQAIEAEMAHRARLRDERRAFTGVLVPVAAAGAAAWVFFLALGNVRERRQEIGILRAIGVGAGRIQRAFLLKALIMGLGGGLLGAPAGLAVGAWLSEAPVSDGALMALADLRVVLAALAGAPLLAALAGLMPSVLAARQDPAVVLRED